LRLLIIQLIFTFLKHLSHENTYKINLPIHAIMAESRLSKCAV
jgi:hypothetical protein